MDLSAVFTVPTHMDLVFVVRSFCGICTVAITVARFIPATRDRVLSYGARRQRVSRNHNTTPAGSVTYFSYVLDGFLLAEVPHDWFELFYVWSLSCSLFWLTNVGFGSRLLHSMDAFVASDRPAVSFRCSLLCVILMTLHSIRRLWEGVKFFSDSKSNMWIGHFVFGMAFYFFVTIAVWIEGIHHITAFRLRHELPISTTDDMRVVVGLLGFSVSSIVQHFAHSHLARLPKYSIPTHWLFRQVVSPHYTAECAIYLSLAMVAAPGGYWFNRTLLCVVLLTTVNLGITAHGTKGWMMDKFRDSREELRKKYCMLPGVW